MFAVLWPKEHNVSGLRREDSAAEQKESIKR